MTVMSGCSYSDSYVGCGYSDSYVRVWLQCRPPANCFAQKVKHVYRLVKISLFLFPFCLFSFIVCF